MNEEFEKIFEKIKKIEEKVDDIYGILKAEKRAKTFSFILKLIYWFIFIGIGIISWSYIEPIYKSFWEAYENITKTNKELQQNFGDLNKKIEKLKNLKIF